MSYKVKLPPKLKIHPVSHVSHLTPYYEDMEDPNRGISNRVPKTVVTSYDKEINYIIAKWVIRQQGIPHRTEYLVKCKGLPACEASRELATTLW